MNCSRNQGKLRSRKSSRKTTEMKPERTDQKVLTKAKILIENEANLHSIIHDPIKKTKKKRERKQVGDSQSRREKRSQKVDIKTEKYPHDQKTTNTAEKKQLVCSKSKSSKNILTSSVKRIDSEHNNDNYFEPSIKCTKRRSKCLKMKQNVKSSTEGLSKYWNDSAGNISESSTALTQDDVQEEDSQSDSDWEEVAELPFLEGLTPDPSKKQILNDPVEITLEAPDAMKKKRKKGGFDWKDCFRLHLNKFRKKTQMYVHKVHLLCLISSGMRLNTMCNDTTLQATALSLLPSNLQKLSPVFWKLNELHKLLKWFTQSFSLDQNLKENSSTWDTCLLSRMEVKKAATELEMVLIFVILCRALGLDVRLIDSLQPTTFKATDLKLKTSKKLPNNADVICIDIDEDEENRKSEKTNNSSASLSSKLSSLKEKSTSKNCAVKTKRKSAKCIKAESNTENHERSKPKSRSTPKNRQLRKCASKVSYVEKFSEASDTDDLMDISPTQVDGQNDKKMKTSDRKRSKDPETMNLSSSDEDFDTEKTSFRSPKLAKRRKSTSKPNISSDETGTDYWSEVFLEKENQWICIDCNQAQLNQHSEIEARATKPLCYVLGYNNYGHIKDVTSSYASDFVTQTHKLRIDPEWWEETLKIFRPMTDVYAERDATEECQIQAKLLQQPLPTSINELKNHQLYVLKRHLLKFEALYPESAIPVGYIKGEAIYARDCVHTLHSRDNWLKEARTVKIGEEPYKHVKSRKRIKDCGAGAGNKDLLTPLFGHWQTEDYVPPPAVDGIVPKNVYGNVDLFQPSMLPPGTVQLRLSGLNKIARKLGIDCPSAMVGWEQHGGYGCPAMDGFVVCVEYKDTIVAAWEEDQIIQLEKAAEKKQKKVLGHWKTFVKGLLVRERMKAKFKLQEPPTARTQTDSGSENLVEPEPAMDVGLSWPRNKQRKNEAAGPSKKKKKIDSIPFPFEVEQL